MESKTKARKWLFIIAVGIVSLLVIFLIALAIGNIVTGNILDKTIARLKSEGFRVSPEGLMPVCSDDENAAIPWEKAQELFGMKTQEAERAYIKSYQNWSSLTEEDKAVLQVAIAANEPVVELMREAASRPYFTFQPDYSKPMATWQRPKLMGISKMCRLLIVTRGRLALDDGNRDEALQCCLLGLKSAGSLSKSPTFLRSMLSILIFNMSVKLCQETMSGAPVPEEVGQELIQFLDPQPLKDGFATALELERLGALDTGIRLAAGEEIKVKWNGYLIDYAPFQGVFAPVLNFLARPMIRVDTAMIQDVKMRVINAMRQPYWEAKPIFEEIDNKIENLSRIHFFARVMIGPLGYSGKVAKFATVEGRAQVTRLALACKLYARENGEFPSSLEELTPAYFKELPRDPYTGKDFVYRLLPEGEFVVYSVGPNERDEGGTSSSDDTVWLETPGIETGRL